MNRQELRRTSVLAKINRLAIVQLVLGILCLINGIAIVAYHKMAIIRIAGAIDIWTELFFIVAGATGIAARSRARINVHMAFCIVASVMAFVLFAEALVFGVPKLEVFYFRVFSWPHIPLAIFALIEFIISIMSAATCCRAVCCQRSPSSPDTMVAYPQQGGPMVISQHQAQYAAQPPVKVDPVVAYPQQDGSVVISQHPVKYAARPPVKVDSVRRAPPTAYPKLKVEKRKPKKNRPVTLGHL